MATSNPSLTVYMGTAANVQAFAGALFGNFSAGGLVQTSDTGQTANASFPAATGTSQSLGYQVWRMGDTLQSTAPVFMKFEIGSGTALNNPSIWLTIGTGSDGAGAITGIIMARTQITNTGVSASYPCYFSSSTNRFSFAIGCYSAGTNYFLCITLERSKDSAMADTNLGLSFKAFAGNTQYHQYIPFTGTVRASQSYASLPAGGALGSLADGTTVGMIPIYPLSASGPVFPGLNLMAYYGADLTQFNPIAATVGGASHTYVPLGATSPLTTANWSTSYFAMLYE